MIGSRQKNDSLTLDTKSSQRCRMRDPQAAQARYTIYRLCMGKLTLSL